MMQATYNRDRGYRLTRMFEAPVDMVFAAWTEPQYLTWFFNPGMPVEGPATVDLRVGGQWRQHMAVNEEEQYYTGGVYREIVPGKRLQFYWGAVGGWPEIDLDNLGNGPVVTLDFTPRGERTEMMFHLQLPDHLSDETEAEWMASGMDVGWGMTIDRLVEQLRKTPVRGAA
jgi:uncharacterized protein YndB with AHSA1/START domain